jgi:hypothetical protein
VVHVFPAAAAVAGEEVFDSAVAAAALAEEAFLLKIDLEVHLAVVAAFDLELGSAADRIDSAWEVFAAALALVLVLATLLEEGIGC